MSAAVLATATAAPAATPALFARLGDIDRKIAAINGRAVQGIYRLLGFLGCAHCHEPEPARTSAHAVHHQVGFDDRSMGGKRVLEVIFGGVEGKVSDKQFGITHVMYTVPRLIFPFPRLFPTIG